MSDPYLNASKTLLEDVGKIFKKLGGNPDMSMFADAPLEKATVFGKWRGSAEIGAKKKHTYRIHSVRREDASAFSDEMVVGHLLLSKKIELARDVTTELVPLEIQGYFSNTGRSVVIRSLAAGDADDATLRAKLDELHEDREYASERFGTLTYRVRDHLFGGQFTRDGRRVAVEFKDTGPDQIAEQCEKLERFFDPADDVAAELMGLVRDHGSFKAHATTEDPELHLSHIWIDGDAVTVNFSAPFLSIAYARAVLRDGVFQYRRVDKIAGPDRVM